jgi:hypothetical protein
MQYPHGYITGHRYSRHLDPGLIHMTHITHLSGLTLKGTQYPDLHYSKSWVVCISPVHFLFAVMYFPIHLPSYLPTLNFSHYTELCDPRKLQAAVSYFRKCPTLAYTLLYIWTILLFICTNFYSLDCGGKTHENQSRGNKGWISYLWSCHMIA